MSSYSNCRLRDLISQINEIKNCLRVKVLENNMFLKVSNPFRSTLSEISIQLILSFSFTTKRGVTKPVIMTKLAINKEQIGNSECLYRKKQVFLIVTQ